MKADCSQSKVKKEERAFAGVRAGKLARILFLGAVGCQGRLSAASPFRPSGLPSPTMRTPPANSSSLLARQYTIEKIALKVFSREGGSLCEKGEKEAHGSYHSNLTLVQWFRRYRLSTQKNSTALGAASSAINTLGFQKKERENSRWLRWKD